MADTTTQSTKTDGIEVFSFFRTYYDAGELLENDAERGLFYRSIFKYIFSNRTENPDFAGNKMMQMAWIMILPHLDRSLNMRRPGNQFAKRNRNANETQMKRNQNANETQTPSMRIELEQEEEKEVEREIDTERECPQGSVFPFEDFWKMYNKDVGKEPSETIYATVSEDDRKIIKENLQYYIDATPNIQYRKDPENWLRGKHWNDLPWDYEDSKVTPEMRQRKGF